MSRIPAFSDGSRLTQDIPLDYGYEVDDQPYSTTRYELTWTAGQAGKPGINTDLVPATLPNPTAGEIALMLLADKEFEISGTAGTTVLCTRAAECGINMATAGSSGNQMILGPHTDADLSAWGAATWGTDRQTVWEARIQSGATITTSIIWAGLKLLSDNVVVTDDDQAFFRYEAGVGSGAWQFISSTNGVDTTTTTDVTVAPSTSYHFRVTFDAGLVTRAYINGELVATSGVVRAADLVPFIGVETSASSARAVLVRGQKISRLEGT